MDARPLLESKARLSRHPDGLLSKSDGWSFSLRSTCDDSDEDSDEATQDHGSSSYDAQLLKTLDLSSREDNALFRPNPWSIAKVNAASRPRPLVLHEPHTPSKQKKPVCKPKQRSIAQAFSKQAASLARSSSSPMCSQTTACSTDIRCSGLYRDEFTPSSGAQRKQNPPVSVSSTVNGPATPYTSDRSIEVPSENFAKQQVFASPLTISPSALSAVARGPRASRQREEAHTPGRSVLPQRQEPSLPRHQKSRAQPFSSVAASHEISDSTITSLDGNTGYSRLIPPRENVAQPSQQNSSDAGVSSACYRNFQASPPPPRYTVTQSIATQIQPDSDVSAHDTGPSYAAYGTSKFRCMSQLSTPIRLSPFTVTPEPEGRTHTNGKQEPPPEYLFAPSTPETGVKLPKRETIYPEAEAYPSVSGMPKNKSFTTLPRSESPFRHSLQLCRSSASPTVSRKLSRTQLAATSSRSRHSVVTAYSSLADPNEEQVWSTIPISKRRKYNSSTSVKSTGKFRLPMALPSSGSILGREGTRLTLYKPPPKNATEDATTILKVRRVGRPGSHDSEDFADHDNPEPTEGDSERNRENSKLTIEHGFNVSVADSTAPSSPPLNVPVPFSVPRVEKNYPLTRKMISERRRVSVEAFEMLDLESCGVVHSDNELGGEVGILKWERFSGV